MVLKKHTTWFKKHTAWPKSIPHGHVVCPYIPYDTQQILYHHMINSCATVYDWLICAELVT